MLGPLEWAVDPGRGDFQRIGPRHYILGIEKLAELVAYPAQIINVGASLFIQVESEYLSPATSFITELDIDNLHTFTFN
jgi:hypothetical protein